MFRISGLFAIFLLTAAGVIGGFCSAASARPLTPAERRYFPWDGILPECGDPEVLERIQSRFYDRESEFWKTGLEIAGFEEVREIGYRSNGLDYIPRRYCVGRAFLNDGRSRSVSYSINKELGITGVGFGVEWCVAGLDRNDAYSPACKMAQP